MAGTLTWGCLALLFSGGAASSEPEAFYCWARGWTPWRATASSATAGLTFAAIAAPPTFEHEVEHLPRQRVLGVTCGYEDLNDPNTLRDAFHRIAALLERSMSTD